MQGALLYNQEKNVHHIQFSSRSLVIPEEALIQGTLP